MSHTFEHTGYQQVHGCMHNVFTTKTARPLLPCCWGYSLGLLFMCSIHWIALIFSCLAHDLFVCWCSAFVVNSVTYCTCSLYSPLVSATDQIMVGHCHLQCAAGMFVGRGASFVPRSQNNSPGTARASQMARCSADHWAGEELIAGIDGNGIGHVSFQWFQSVSTGSRSRKC